MRNELRILLRNAFIFAEKNYSQMVAKIRLRTAGFETARIFQGSFDYLKTELLPGWLVTFLGKLKDELFLV